MEIHLFQVLPGERTVGDQLPDHRAQVQGDRFPGPDRNSEQNAWKSRVQRNMKLNFLRRFGFNNTSVESRCSLPRGRVSPAYNI